MSKGLIPNQAAQAVRVSRSEPTVESVLNTLDSEGYGVVDDVLSPEALEGARDAIVELLANTPLGRNDFEGRATKRVYALFAKTRVLDRLLKDYQLGAPTAIEVGPGSVAQALHPDDATYPVQRPHAELVVNVMWPLDDFTEQNGATRIVPGSHRWVDHQPGPGTATTSVAMSAGSAMFCLGGTWHGSGPNSTDRSRIGVIIHYSAGWLRPVENHLLAVPKDVVRRLPERLQELIGYNIAPPFIGYVDGRHPRRLLKDA